MELKDVVKEKYGQAALRVTAGGSSCCGAARRAGWLLRSDHLQPLRCLADRRTAPRKRYWPRSAAEIPRRWLSCTGETVLDLGSGGGIDVLLSARRVGRTGKAYGLDMTDEMLALARENQRKAGVENVEFLKGEIEHIPLPDNSVDVVISNCVINLSADKDRVLQRGVSRSEAGRPLRRLRRGHAGVLSPKMSVKTCSCGLAASPGRSKRISMPPSSPKPGFEGICIEPTRVYNIEDARAFLSGQGIDVDAIAPQVEGKFMSAFIRATKPAACCAPGCCK